MLKIRLLGAPKPPGWRHSHVTFDPEVPPDCCDGLFAWHTPTPELLSFRGPKAWYVSEPINSGMFTRGLGSRLRKVLREDEFLHHSNRNPKYRIPAVTHYEELTLAPERPRTGDIVATVSNFGNRVWWLRPALRLRTTFIVHSRVDLYGNPEAWNRFRRWPWSKAAPPQSYRGPTTVLNCWLPNFIEFLSRYRAYVCFENSNTPYWFTEKFVNAARAGCVPVYHAHKTVAETFLQGARWIDPAHFDFDVEQTLEAALHCDAATIREANYKWLSTDLLKETEGYRIWNRIADLFAERIASERAASHPASPPLTFAAR